MICLHDHMKFEFFKHWYVVSLTKYIIHVLVSESVEYLNDGISFKKKWARVENVLFLCTTIFSNFLIIY